MPLSEEGILIEPPPSDAIANGETPVTTDAHDPALEPPGVKSVFHGFLVVSKTGLCPAPL